MGLYMKSGTAFASLLLFLCVFVAAQPAVASNAERWDAYTKQFIESYLKLHPDLAVWLGRHEFDGMLPDWSPEGLNRQISWLHQQRDSIMAFDSKSMDTLRHLEHELLLTEVNGDLFWLEEVKEQYRNPTFYSLDPSVYIIRGYAPLETRIAAYTRFANAVPAAVEQIKRNLHPPLARPFIDIGETVFGGFATYFQNDVPAVFGEVRDSVLQEKFLTANVRAIRAMNDLTAWLEHQKSTATDSFALGPRLFSEMLRVNERVDMPLGELERIGKQDLEQNLAALREACARYAPGKSIQDCIKMEAADKPAGD